MRRAVLTVLLALGCNTPRPVQGTTVNCEVIAVGGKPFAVCLTIGPNNRSITMAPLDACAP